MGERYNHDLCDCCNEGGDLICCDACPCSFHIECVDPPLGAVPAGQWFCPACAHSSSSSSARKRQQQTPPWVRQSALQPVVARLLAANPALFELPAAVTAGHEGLPHRRRTAAAAARRLKGVECECCELPSGQAVRCSLCPRRYHLFCLEPPLLSVPPFFVCERHIPEQEFPRQPDVKAASDDYLLQSRIKLDFVFPPIRPGRIGRNAPGLTAESPVADTGELKRMMAQHMLREPGSNPEPDPDSMPVVPTDPASGGMLLAGAAESLSQESLGMLDPLIRQFGAWKQLLSVRRQAKEVFRNLPQDAERRVVISQPVGAVAAECVEQKRLADELSRMPAAAPAHKRRRRSEELEPETPEEAGRRLSTYLKSVPQNTKYARLVLADCVDSVVCPLSKPVVVIGRENSRAEIKPDLDLKQLFGPNLFKWVSHVHAKIVFDFEKKWFSLIVLGKVGLKLDGTALEPNSVVPQLKDGQVLSFKDINLRFVAPPDFQHPSPTV